MIQPPIDRSSPCPEPGPLDTREEAMAARVLRGIRQREGCRLERTRGLVCAVREGRAKAADGGTARSALAGLISRHPAPIWTQPHGVLAPQLTPRVDGQCVDNTTGHAWFATTENKSYLSDYLT